jgi:hypothetical protein
MALFQDHTHGSISLSVTACTPKTGFHFLARRFNGLVERMTMSVRLRKLIGTVLLVALVILYALVATTVAVARLAEAHWSVHLAYFFLTGLLWVLPAMVLIRWMAGPSPKDGTGR